VPLIVVVVVEDDDDNNNVFKNWLCSLHALPCQMKRKNPDAKI
jgi:hypothetical protein